MENNKAKASKWPEIEEGIILGIIFGFAYGLIFLDGNVLLGMIPGMLAGLVLATIFTSRKRRQPG